MQRTRLHELTNEEQSLKALRKSGPIRTLFLTCYDGSDVLFSCRRCGAGVYIGKAAPCLQRVCFAD